MTLPKSCSLADLALFARDAFYGDAIDPEKWPRFDGVARAVRALLEDVATRTARDVANGPFVTEREIPAVVARVLDGAP